ncbi:CiaD-like domain-containing protein [Helicobacter apodemus]|uniref:Campylobacter invasion antigen D C-terminal domain-containing protein n=1 Tax=Helicobacter apodemus TaxID=135569 RepID=A0A2U8FG62_9HELI|nr:hypothetical protein [Helicobacter apodemus]AWI34495.1 hypothetical protein CDV25_06760 [Helicobacter apodemus]
MELKEAILQTLAEMDTNLKKPLKEMKLERDELLDVSPTQEESLKEVEVLKPYQRKIEKLNFKDVEALKEILKKHYLDEEKFLNTLQERILVLFEGLQSPNNRNIENKVDMILNFLEFTLAIIDEKKNAK